MSLLWVKQTEWTDELKGIVRDLWERGSSASQIARELVANNLASPGLTRSAIIGLVHRNGFTKSETFKKPPRAPRAPRNNDGTPASILKLVEFEESTQPVEFLGISLLDLEAGQCRFPRGDDSPFLFCGQPAKPNSSYCPSCYRLTVQSRTTQAQREASNRAYLRRIRVAA